MTSISRIFVTLVAATAILASPSPVERRQSGTYVQSISQCPKLTKRTATSVHDLRPDDFTVVMAIGDSITAGCWAKGLASNGNPFNILDEWRGVSYPIGGDSGALTIPNLIKYYTPGVVGASKGHHLVAVCVAGICTGGYEPDIDQLNAAVSGALGEDMLQEVRDYLVPRVRAMNISDSAFKYLNVQIGSNDLCGSCDEAITPANADAYEQNIRNALEYVRLNIPNVVVNLVSNIPVSQIYDLTLNEPYCSKVIPTPHLNLLCKCALLGGDIGQLTRYLMDSLQRQYDERLLKIAKDYQRAAYPSFAVVYQPLNVQLRNWPIESVSDVDCFHPSEAAHRGIAAQLWNRLTLDKTSRAESFSLTPGQYPVRCLQEGDRIQTKAEL